MTPVQKLHSPALRDILKSTIITSQLPVKSWHNYLGDPTIADALLDRFLSQATQIELQGESLRWDKPQKPQNIEEGSTFFK